jgi:hypothetical protein
MMKVMVAAKKKMHPRHRQPALLLLPTGMHYFS